MVQWCSMRLMEAVIRPVERLRLEKIRSRVILLRGADHRVWVPISVASTLCAALLSLLHIADVFVRILDFCEETSV